MNKKMMMVTVLVCVVCFGAAFMFAYMTKGPVAAKAAEANAVDANSVPKAKAAGQAGEESGATTQRGMSEKQLKLLVQSLRAKVTECDKRETELNVREQRIQTAREQMQKDVNDLTALQVQLANTEAKVKEEKETLAKYQLTVSEDEVVSLKRTAVIYDKMDSAGASKIMVDMCKNKQIEDAVKIINYMSEKNAAKVLGEIAGAEPKIAGDICMGLKRLKEASK